MRLKAVWIHPDKHERLSRIAKAQRYSRRYLTEAALDAQYAFMSTGLGGFTPADVKEFRGMK